MGGNAIKQAHGVDTARLAANDYAKVAQFARYVVHPNKSAIIPAYADKLDFGDVDILYIPQKPVDFSTYSLVVNNGSVTSVGFPLGTIGRPTEYFQADFIKVPEETFDFALNYFSYNDLGNLLGRVAHRMGLKFGHEGLFAVVRQKSNTSEVRLTTDYSKALTVLGYDPHPPTFRDLESIFRYVITSPFFSRDLFPLEHRNAQARLRDRKRATYRQFLQWLDEHTEIPDGAKAIPYAGSVRREGISMDVLTHVQSVIPDAGAKMGNLQAHLTAQKVFQRRFNGELVAEITGLSGEHLGQFIKSFKAHIGNALFTYWVLASTKDEIKVALKAFKPKDQT